MPWTKGQSGNPLGRLPGEKEFADQLRMVLAEPVDKDDPQSVRKMRRVAEKLVDCALEGQSWAIAQIADRIDGKPAQMLIAAQTEQVPRRRLVREIVHVTETREEFERKENRDLAVEYSEIKNGNGNGRVNGNGHEQ